MREILAIGGTTRDAFFEVDLPLTKWPKTPTGKALAIPFGEKFVAKEVYFTMGGNAANASITFARQGLRTAIFTKIGMDVSGDEVRRMWKKEGVDTRLVMTSDEPTKYSIILSQGGERSIISYQGAINKFSFHDVPMKLLKSKWWYVTLPGESYKEFTGLLKYAKRAGVKVAMNPSYKHLYGPGRRELLKHLKELSFLVVNEGEAAQITGIPFKREKEVFKKLDELVPGVVAVTSGPKGVTVSDGNYIYRAGIFKNKKIVDRTGAGDAFGSGFVSGLIRKKEKFKGGISKPENIEYAIRLASANATSVVEQLGGTEGALTRKEFDTGKRFRSLRIAKEKLH